jgi:hypothetical protein
MELFTYVALWIRTLTLEVSWPTGRNMHVLFLMSSFLFVFFISVHVTGFVFIFEMWFLGSPSTFPSSSKKNMSFELQKYPGPVFIKQLKLRFIANRKIIRFLLIWYIRTPDETLNLSCFMNTGPESFITHHRETNRFVFIFLVKLQQHSKTLKLNWYWK